MRFLLTAVNAKYIHSNPAVYSLQAYACQEDPTLKEQIFVAEYDQPADGRCTGRSV